MLMSLLPCIGCLAHVLAVLPMPKLSYSCPGCPCPCPSCATHALADLPMPMLCCPCPGLPKPRVSCPFCPIRAVRYMPILSYSCLCSPAHGQGQDYSNCQCPRLIAVNQSYIVIYEQQRNINLADPCAELRPEENHILLPIKCISAYLHLFGVHLIIIRSFALSHIDNYNCKNVVFVSM